MQFTQGLHRAAQQRPGATATVSGPRRQTFAQLIDRVARLAGGLQALGVQPGERVAMYGLNDDRYLEYYLAVPWAGAVVNPVNFRWAPAEVAYSLQDSETAVLFVDDQFGAHSAELREQCPSLREVVFTGDGECPVGAVALEDLIARGEPIEDAGRRGDDLFGIFYTGGTTGKPKGVMLSHTNVCSSGLALLAEGAFAGDPVGLHAAPMFHLADLMMVTGLLQRGGCHVMLRAFHPDAVLELIKTHNISDLLLVPAMLQAVVDACERGDADTGMVQRIYYGASPASETLLTRTMRAFPAADLTQVYGMTEMSAVISVLPPRAHGQHGGVKRMLSGGRASLHVAVRVVDADGAELPRGEVGELIARGPGVMQGYLNMPEASAEAVKNGWMHTGDLGTMDDEGFLYVVDRAKDMIISGGENVYSAEVENAVAAHDAVAACAVIGIPSAKWGEAVHAVVVLKEGHSLTDADLAAHCKALIAGYKCPRSMEVVEALPLSGAGKILKKELRAPYWRDSQRQVG